MKGKIITQECYEEMFGFNRQEGFAIKRILIPAANNLVITLYNNQLFIWAAFIEKGEDFKVVKEIEIADELVNEAIDVQKRKEELIEKLEALIDG